MKRFLDVLLIFSLTLLLFSFFINSGKDKVLEDSIEVSFQKSKYTIPAKVNVLVQNNTGSGVILNTCNDINILRGGEKIEFSSEFCKDIEVGSLTTKLIDYSSEYAQFTNVGKYSLKASLENKEFIDQFDLKNRGIIAKTFIGLIYKPIYNVVIGLLQIFNSSLGWAIVGITLILKLILLWPQHKMMVSQKKIQGIQPKIKQIQEQYKGNQQKIGEELMALYKKEKVNPMGTCGFLLIQMPILLVVYNIIVGIQSVSNEYYLYGFFEGFHLESINYNFFGLDLLGVGGLQGLLLALSVAGVQFLQVKVSLSNQSKDKNTNKDKEIVIEKKKDSNDYSQLMPNPEVMNKFMLYGMPLMIGFITFTWFAAIGLYWGISTIFMLIQNLVVNKMFNK